MAFHGNLGSQHKCDHVGEILRWLILSHFAHNVKPLLQGREPGAPGPGMEEGEEIGEPGGPIGGLQARLDGDLIENSGLGEVEFEDFQEPCFLGSGGEAGLDEKLRVFLVEAGGLEEKAFIWRDGQAGGDGDVHVEAPIAEIEGGEAFLDLLYCGAIQPGGMEADTLGIDVEVALGRPDKKEGRESGESLGPPGAGAAGIDEEIPGFDFGEASDGGDGGEKGGFYGGIRDEAFKCEFALIGLKTQSRGFLPEPGDEVEGGLFAGGSCGGSRGRFNFLMTGVTDFVGDDARPGQGGDQVFGFRAEFRRGHFAGKRGIEGAELDEDVLKFVIGGNGGSSPGLEFAFDIVLEEESSCQGIENREQGEKNGDREFHLPMRRGRLAKEKG